MIDWKDFFGQHCSLHHSAQQMEGVGGTGSENVLDLEVSQVYQRHLIIEQEGLMPLVCM